jgi:D-alanyl-D-alanine dipeptidase
VTALVFAVLLATAGDELVDVPQLVPDAVLDIRYATAQNFLGRKLYPVARCLLRRPVAEQLARAAQRLRARGYRLRLWDCYRPRAIQWEVWRSRPQRGYVADPRWGSNHNRGAAVDLSLLTADGRDVEMPTPFDGFAPRARANATAGVTPAARRNRRILREAMEAEGFAVNRAEWWHYDAPAARTYRLLDVPLESAAP